MLSPVPLLVTVESDRRMLPPVWALIPVPELAYANAVVELDDGTAVRVEAVAHSTSPSEFETTADAPLVIAKPPLAFRAYARRRDSRPRCCQPRKNDHSRLPVVADDGVLDGEVTERSVVEDALREAVDLAVLDANIAGPADRGSRWSRCRRR